MAKVSIYLSSLILTIIFIGNALAGDQTMVNNKGVAHKGSNGVSATFPDVCETPTPGGPIPIPYPNISQSSDTAKGSKRVKMDGNPIMLKGSKFKTSEGDEPGNEERVGVVMPKNGSGLKGVTVVPVDEEPAVEKKTGGVMPRD